MVRTRFGAFLAPHHPTGEHPTLLMQRDLDLAAHLDRLGFEEFWCGEHHSSGWETIASPEMFLAAAGQLTHRIGLGAGASVVGTPDDMVAAIRRLQEVTGGFGVVLGFAHDWADREATFRSWELFARYVIPEINGYTERFRQSQQYLHDHQSELIAGAGKAVMSKIMAHDGAAAALATMMEQRDAATGQTTGQTSEQPPQQSEFRPGAGVPGKANGD